MHWQDLERSFLKAWSLAFSRGKLLLGFGALVVCGLFFVFCKAMALEATPWIRMSMVFLPILLSSGVMLTLGTLLIRLYSHEVRGLALPFGRLFAGSLNVAMGTSYLSLPPIVAYLILWIGMGFFFLLKEIPFIGPFLNVILSFGPFFIIVCSLVLCAMAVGVLFFLAPVTAHSTLRRIDWKIWEPIKARPFRAIALFVIALSPVLLTGLLLSVAAAITTQSFATPAAALPFEWFFLMIPFCALLTPSVVFFFHFAQESNEYLCK